MTAKKLFATLVFLTILCSIMGFLNSGSMGALNTMAASQEMDDHRKDFSCANPRGEEDRAACAEIEAQILASTVRIELLTWMSSDGQQKQLLTKSHATILADRYLVTHNHFRHNLSNQVEVFGDESGYAAILLRDTNGRLLLEYDDLKVFTVVYQDEEILVLAFLDEHGKGLFEAANLPSAKFADRNVVALEEGDELAQIDWDGVTAHVDWVRVDHVIEFDDVPQIQVDNFPLKGSSGGGVFLDGVHVGINWMRNTKINQATGEVTGQYSTVALNSAIMLEVSQ
jgi:hypothetical protein